MDNIMLSWWILCVFAVLVTCFIVTPFAGGRGKCFGFPAEKILKKSRILKIYFIVLSIVLGILSAIACILKPCAVFVNIAAAVYILAEIILYIILRNRARKLSGITVIKEIIVNELPSDYKVRGVGIYWFLLYLVPIAVTVYFGRYDGYVICAAAFEFALMFAGAFINLLLKRMANYVDGDVGESVKKNVKYREIWCRIGYAVLLIMSFAVMLVYLGYAGVIFMGDFIYTFAAIVFIFAVIFIIVCACIFNRKK